LFVGFQKNKSIEILRHMAYNHQEIEKKWQQYWREHKTFKAENSWEKPKYYVLDMFPYPSGAGLHVGHPLGYIASDIYARYKRHQGFNVLHPMGYDAYGLPAEQFAIQTGTHPEITTEKNIKRYRQQLDQIGFSFDWDREVRTSDPDYYKWTQWTFIQLFNAWYNKKADKAEPISALIALFETNGNSGVEAVSDEVDEFTAEQWKAMTEKEQQEILMHYRLAYLSETMVNWCPALGTVLANDEVKEGLSERGGYPVERKLMKQWSLRITAYAQRLLDGLDRVDWPDSLKEMQRNWIGRSEGASLRFQLADPPKNLESYEGIEVFTTRPDTLFGATFMVLAPEHELIAQITTDEYRDKVETYVEWAKNRSERERMTEVKKVTGEFTGAYAINPLNGEKVPIWIADYVLAGYGTGAIMAVPAHDSRDFAFACHFHLPIIQVVGKADEEASDPAEWEESYDAKEGVMIHSGFLNGLQVKEAIRAAIDKLEALGIGKGKINFRLRDAIFSRQRYWGEPFPIYYKDGMPYPLPVDELPLKLPEVDKYLPTETGEPPLARAKNWKTKEGYPLETNTMPGFAGSSGYYLRYMDPHNDHEYFSKEANQYWRNVDLYIGGDEHAAGHLIYSRFWNKFLYDLGLACEPEPFKKLINQGKIQGRSSFVYRVNMEKYAEYLLWERIKQMGFDKEVIRSYKDGRRQFDFYHKTKDLIIEIKSRDKLEKLEPYYEAYVKETNKRLILIPVADIIENLDVTINEITQALEATQKGVIFNQGEIRELKPLFVSKNIPGRELFSTPLHVDINFVDNDVLDIEAFKQWRPEFADAEFVLEDGKYICGYEVEKMSKSKHNVQNPDDLIEKYGADTLRLYEMFLGPIDQDKPWDIKGIEGVYRFLRKLWRLYFDEEKLIVTDDRATEAEQKVMHKTIKKLRDDIERFSFNTGVSAFMICVNELTDLKCHKREILEPLAVLLEPYAPHVAEELWSAMGYEGGVSKVAYPEFDEKYLKEDNFSYPVSFNGKMRFKIDLPVDLSKEEIEKAVLAADEAQRWLEGKTIRKIIVVPKRIVNVVVG
jgi:leucyl-tRNA synthetase